MRYKVLVVEDNPKFAQTVQRILRSLGDECDIFTTQQEARQALASSACEQYRYVLLDMEIPVDTEDSVPRVPNGKNLLAEILKCPWLRKAPVIVMTGHGVRDYKLAVDVMQMGAASFIGKPDLESRLDEVIGLVLQSQSTVEPAKPIAPSCERTTFQGGELFLYESHIELAGVEIEISSLMRDAFEYLKQPSASGKYMPYSGKKMAKLVGFTSASSWSGSVLRLRDTISELLAERGIECGKQDVILSGGRGYRLHDWITVRDGYTGNVEGAAAPETAARGGTNGSKAEAEHPLDELQQWIVGQLQQGVALQVQAIVKRRNCSQSTVKRALTELRRLGLIEFVGPNRTGHYELVK